MAQKKKGEIGLSFDAFLAEEGILESCKEQAVKQILADQIKAAMEKDRLYQIGDGYADADQQAGSGSAAGSEEYWRDAAHIAACGGGCWETAPFGIGVAQPGNYEESQETYG